MSARDDGRAVPVDVDGVRIRHDGRQDWTPDGVTFSVERGEVVLLLGPSGSGKSTLTLALDGLVPHAVVAELQGSVRVGGLDTVAHSVAELSQHVALVFQDPDAQIVTGSILDEVCFAPENRLAPVEVVLARAEDALRQVGLWERRHDDPDVLSGGGKQRLAIAAALASGSDVLVLDEPTANLDAAGTEDVYAALRDVVALGDRSVVLVEHDLDAAVGLVDRVVLLDGRGRLVAQGTPRQILADRAAEVEALGVWLPTATLAALRLAGAGIAFASLPLTGEELAAALNERPDLPPLAADTRERPAVVAAPAVAISVRSLSLSRGRGRSRRRVLRDVDLEVRSGDFVAIVGTNGAGKSTLVEAIAGVLRPPRGAVSVGGVDPARASASIMSERVGFVFQNPEHQFVTHTVRDELAYGLHSRGLDRDEISARVDDVLSRFDLASAADVSPFLLSGGQKRRLSVGTALVGGASVLVLDEPTFGQDRANAEELLGLLASLHRGGTTVVIVTHDLQLVAEFASRVVVMAEGRVLAHDTTEAVLRDETLLERAGLRLPPLARAMRLLRRHPEWREATQLAHLPSGDDA